MKLTFFLSLLSHFLRVPCTQCRLRIQSRLPSIVEQQRHGNNDDRGMLLDLSSQGPFLGGQTSPSSCLEALMACKAHHAPGTLSYEGWSNFLGKLNDNANDDGDDPDNVVAQLKTIVDLASQLGSPAEIRQQVIDGLANEEIAAVVHEIANLQQEQEQEQEQDSSSNDEVTESDIFAIKNALRRIPNIGNVVYTIIQITTLLAFPIFLPLLGIYKLLDCAIKGFDYPQGLILICSRLSRVEETVFTEQDEDCQAELISCELEALLFEVIPAVLEESFIQAGSA